MTNWKRDTDRRGSVRFEIVGRLHGTIVSEEPVVVHNLSQSGALVSASWSVPVDSVHTVVLASESAHDTLQARVRHVRLGHDARYLIGMEFMAAGPHVEEHLERLLAGSRTTIEDA